VYLHLFVSFFFLCEYHFWCTPFLFTPNFSGTQLQRKTRPWNSFSPMWHLISDQWWRSFFTAQLPMDVLPTQHQFTAFHINFAVIDRCDTDHHHHHHHRLYSPGWALASSWGFVTMFSYGVELLASRPTPNLEGQGITFCLGHYPWPVWHGRPYQ
jgi:hypothetical protein